jgi:hypothetical protein
MRGNLVDAKNRSQAWPIEFLQRLTVPARADESLIVQPHAELQ